MDTLTVVLLVLMALLSLAQSTLLVRLFFAGRRTVLGLEDLANRLVDDLTPVARDLTRATANAGAITDLAVEQAQRVDAVVEELAASVSHATGRLYEAVVPTFGRLALVAAGWRLVKRGRGIYRWLRG
jgi:hypothetical protein